MSKSLPPIPITPAHGHTLVFWTDASVLARANSSGPAGIACVAEEHDEYVMHHMQCVPHMSSTDAEMAAVVLAQHMICRLDEEAQARACIVTDCTAVLLRWWQHDSYRGGAPLFIQPPGRRPNAYYFAHDLANWARHGTHRNNAPTWERYLESRLERLNNSWSG